MNLSILYRGPLSSCNYGCNYCPFAKHTETRAQHDQDRQALKRFVTWVATQRHHQIAIFFTPWGEALIHRRYQQALIELTRLSHVSKVVIQTNLACRLEWVEGCDKHKLGLWVTYHPSQVPRTSFLARCAELTWRGVRFSVGMVGVKENACEIEEIRSVLPPNIYLWINAYKREMDYYTTDEVTHFTAIDPLFPLNNQHHPSQGHACRCGETVIAVDGAGTIRRCHFLHTPLGNIYIPGWEQSLLPRPCTSATCGCHIGYVHMPYLGLYDVFDGGILERIPAKHAQETIRDEGER